MIRRLLAVPVLVLLALLLPPAVAGAQLDRAPGAAAHTTSTTATATATPTPAVSTRAAEDIPGTTLEAEARDNDTSLAPWLIGSGMAAAAVVVLGGLLLKRRMD